MKAILGEAAPPPELGAGDDVAGAGAGTTGAGGVAATGAETRTTSAGVAGDGTRTDGIEIRGPSAAEAGEETEIAGAGCGAAGARFALIRALVASVLSLPQTGQWTAPGETPLTGSTSNLNLAPHGQRILISITAFERAKKLRLPRRSFHLTRRG
jgi:hypothetical protein